MDAQAPPRPLRRLHGSCHCGAVRFVVESDFPELTYCDCALCKRRSALRGKVHPSAFSLLAGAEQLANDQFHSHTAVHHFCKLCGIDPFHRKRVTPEFYGVNVACLDGSNPAGIPVRAAVDAATA